MKPYKLIIFAFSFIVLLNGINLGQEIPEPPEPPAPSIIGYFGMSEGEEQEYIKNISAELKAHLKEIKENNKERYYELLREYYFSNLKYPMMRQIEKQMRDTESEIVENEIYTESLSAKYKKSKAGEKDKLKADLEKAVTKLFDLKENLRKNEVNELENRLKELKDKMTARQKNKSTIIKRRLEELLGDDKYLEWE